MNSIPAILKSEDIIYHYTSFNNALKILESNSIRLSPRTNSFDPIESSPPFITEGAMASCDEELIALERQSKNSSAEIRRKIKKLNAECKHICFCMNDYNSEYRKYEDMGFLKPRMWDQYANHYNGVCFAFSLGELNKENTLHKKVEYYDYKELGYNGIYIEWNKVHSEGYENALIEKLKNQFFKKHKDYSGENEYRICTFSNSEFDEIDIKGSIKAIIISHMNKVDNRNIKSKIRNIIGEKPEIEIVDLSWFSNDISINTESHKRIFVKAMQKSC